MCAVWSVCVCLRAHAWVGEIIHLALSYSTKQTILDCYNGWWY